MMFYIPCFKGRHCWLSDCYWYCNKLKPELWCLWQQLREGGVCIYSASQLFPSSSWIIHGEIISFLAQTLLDLPERRFSYSSLWHLRTHNKQKLIKEPFSLSLSNREFVKEKETNSIALQFICNWTVPWKGLAFTFIKFWIFIKFFLLIVGFFSVILMFCTCIW